MFLLYNIAIQIYLLGIKSASLFNSKADLWLKGRKDLFARLEEALNGAGKERKSKIAWFHCASLGEFEQGRPIIEAFKSQFPGFKILLTFFSPSGYEIRKNYPEADYIFYLPADTPGNARRFIAMVQPEMVFFVKYDFWYNFLTALGERGIPVYFVSAVFRPGHYFFHWYGRWFRKQLGKIHWFFLQDENSAKLLSGAGIRSFSVTGDTRFDRVLAVVERAHDFPLVDRFKGDARVILGGSTWPQDEQVLHSMMKNKDDKIKFIIAPHETDPKRIEALMAELPRPGVKFSDLNPESAKNYDILVIDSIGLLAFLYQYATISLIGGGFGAGIHNILESAAFGVPVIFGPNYTSFNEAKELILLGGAFSADTAAGCEEKIRYLLTDAQAFEKSSIKCRNYVMENRGATAKILTKLHGENK